MRIHPFRYHQRRDSVNEDPAVEEGILEGAEQIRIGSALVDNLSRDGALLALKQLRSILFFHSHDCE